MNIFVLDNDPIVAAQYHNDNHCSKMILETAQMLCTVKRMSDGVPTKVLMPRTKWCTLEEYNDKYRNHKVTDIKEFETNDEWDIHYNVEYYVEKEINVLPTDIIVDGVFKDKLFYFEAHKGHPCTLWAKESINNYKWLCRLGLALGSEKMYRTGIGHSSIQIILACIADLPKNLADIPQTSQPQAMPDDCKVEGDVVAGYRKYYQVEKRHLAKWHPKRGTPYWWC